MLCTCLKCRKQFSVKVGTIFDNDGTVEADEAFIGGKARFNENKF